MPAAPAASRRAREREARLERIRRAAARVFAERGYEAATMEQVAEAAELGKATLYHYFRTKQALFTDLAVQAADEMARLSRERLDPAAPPLDAAEAIYRLSLDFFRREPDLAALLLPLMARGQAALAGSLGPEAAARVAASHAPFHRLLGPLAAELPGGRALVPLLATLLIGLVTKARHGDVDALEAELDLFFALLRRGRAPSP